MISSTTSDTINAALGEAAKHAFDSIFVLEGDANAPVVTWCNRAFADSLKLAEIEIVGAPLSNFMTWDEEKFSLNEVRRLIGMVQLRVSDGSTPEWVAAALPIRNGEITSWVVRTVSEDSDLFREQRLRESEDRFRALSEQAPIGIFSSEVGLRFEFVNDAFADLLGVPATRVMGTEWMKFVDERDLELVTSGLEKVLHGQRFESPIRLRNVEQAEVWVNLQVVPIGSEASPAGFLGTVEDVTERRSLEEFLSWQANHDPLTQLKNRAELTLEVQEALDTAPEKMALLFFDLDDFKNVNDSYGHAVGDGLLISIAHRLAHSVRNGDTVFRFAGDEFVVLARDITSDEEALGFAERIRTAVSQPANIRGLTFAVGCSVGIVRGDASKHATELIHDADTAMYNAKSAGKGSVHLIDNDELLKRDAEALLARNILAAIESESLWLEYQPIVPPATGIVHGVDALLCWDDTEFGPVSGEQIVKAAVLGGRTEEVTNFVISQICADLAAWRAMDQAPDWVSVNFAPDQLLVPGVVNYLARTLLTHKLAGSDLAIEMNELLWATSDERLQDAVEGLTSMGCRLVLDRVGAALSSLNSLAESNLSAIKLDPGFAFDRSQSAKPVVAAIVQLARALDLQVIAAGVETEADHLKSLALDIGWVQGAAIGQPVIAAAVPTLFGDQS